MIEGYGVAHTESLFLLSQKAKEKFHRNDPNERLDFGVAYSAEVPGPGYYNVKTSGIDTNVGYTIKSRTESEYKTDTSNVPFYVLPKLDKSPHFSIQNRGEIKFFEMKDGPLPHYVLPSTLKQTDIRIGHRTKSLFDIDANPGPGQYNPMHIRRKSYSCMEKLTTREDIWPEAEQIPGPGSYDPVPPPPKPRKWSEFLRKVSPKHPVAYPKRLHNPTLKQGFKFIHI